MNELANSGSLPDALLARRIQFRRSASDPAEISICCPFCNDHKFRLGVNTQKDLAHCFNCSWKSRKAVEDLAEALELGILAGGLVAEEKAATSEPPALPDDFVLLADPPKGVLYRKAREYLVARGVLDWQMREKKIGVSFCGKFSYRIIFPVYYKRKLQGLVTRDYTGQQEPKYLNSFGTKLVYNVPEKKKNKAVLCEGVFDCLALEQTVPLANYDVLALLGHGLTDAQEEQLEDYRDLILWPDADVPGVKGFLEIGQRLAMRHRMFVVPPTNTGKDAADMTRSDRAFAWATRMRLTDAFGLKLKVEAEFRE